jgi:hypothetical protein
MERSEGEKATSKNAEIPGRIVGVELVSEHEVHQGGGTEAQQLPGVEISPIAQAAGEFAYLLLQYVLQSSHSLLKQSVRSELRKEGIPCTPTCR